MGYNLAKKKTYKVVQSNTLVKAQQNLSWRSFIIIRYAISKIKYDDTSFNELIFSFDEISKILRLNKEKLRQDAKKLSDEMLHSTITFYNENISMGRTWLTICDMNTKKGFMRIKLNPELEPFLLQLRQNYCTVDIDKLIDMRSFYSGRLFELLHEKIFANIEKSTKPQHTVELSIDELRFSLCCENKLKQWREFKEKVLEKAKRDINKLCGYKIDYDISKTGKKITGIKFTLEYNYKISENDKVSTKPMLTETKYTSEVYDIMKSLGINRSLGTAELEFIDKWSKEYGFSKEIIKEACSRTLITTGKANFKYVDAILSKWYSSSVKTLEDIKKLDEAYEKEPKVPSHAKKGNFCDFPQRTYEDLDALIIQKWRKQQEVSE